MNNKGFAVFFVTIIVLMAMFGIIMNISIITYLHSKLIRNITRSNQAYYASDSGLEDALLTLKIMPNSSAFSYNFNVGSAIAAVDVSNAVGGSRTINSQGSVANTSKKNQIVWAIDLKKISFFYGAQIGEGGLVLGNSGAEVKGNVFSNGSITVAGGGKCSAVCIDNNVVVAGSGNRIDGLIVGGNAMVHTCVNSNIAGELTYVSGGSTVGCIYGSGKKERPNEIDPIALPISSDEAQEWKNDASESVFYGDYSLGNGDSAELGPMQINGNLTLGNNSHLTLTGTIYVTGNVIFNQGAVVNLNSGVYGSLSGVVIADGKVNVGNGVLLSGTGEEGSYILVISENNSLDPGSPAISVGNNAQGAIFYSNYGLIRLNNNMSVREVTGYKVWINNNAVIKYESGLENANFVSGTGGGWKIKSWKEIE